MRRRGHTTPLLLPPPPPPVFRKERVWGGFGYAGLQVGTVCVYRLLFLLLLCSGLKVGTLCVYACICVHVRECVYMCACREIGCGRERGEGVGLRLRRAVLERIWESVCV
jgi:hypothetical protein